MSERLRLTGLLMLEVAVVAGLHSLSRLDGFAVQWSDFGQWLDSSPYEDVVAAVLLLVALAIAYWLLISTAGYAGALVSGSPGLMRAARIVTVPAIRRLTQRALAISIAVSAVTGSVAPAIAGGASDATVVVDIGPDGQLRPPGTERPDESPVLPPHLPIRPEPDPVETLLVEEQLDGTVAHTVTVRRGDHMWSLAEEHLERVLGRTNFDDREVARYWVTVIDANRSTIRSGNPDLIYPGETLTLPPVG
ncbi:MAG: hypothetical protein KJO87_06440 [Acidimicrobiia bacterium]|nr:hypothetical protein [Acidimicrobiia bacterium]